MAEPYLLRMSRSEGSMTRRHGHNKQRALLSHLVIIYNPECRPTDDCDAPEGYGRGGCAHGDEQRHQHEPERADASDARRRSARLRAIRDAVRRLFGVWVRVGRGFKVRVRAGDGGDSRKESNDR